MELNEYRPRRHVGRIAALLAGTVLLIGAGSAPKPCCYTNPRYSGVCAVPPGEGETCQSILDYLNNPQSQGKTYCGNTSVRGGWKQATCEKILVMQTPMPRPPVTAGSPTVPPGGTGGTGTVNVGTSGGATDPFVTGDTGFRPYPGCEKPLVYDMKCYTEKFPPDSKGKSDVACWFQLVCCGIPSQGWTRIYRQAAGPSGLVTNKYKETGYRCNDPRALDVWADTDQDGITNFEDVNPLSTSNDKPPWIP